jgi:intraflagellar transport protein 81
VQKLEEEVRVNAYIVEEKLPRELASKKRHVATLDQVANGPAMGHSDLQNVRNKVNSASLKAYLNLWND